jgi:hypothetical protein
MILKGSDNGVKHSESLGLRTFSGIWNSNELEKPLFQKLDLFPSSGEEREAATLLGPLERANPSFLTCKWKQIQFLKRVF